MFQTVVFVPQYFSCSAKYTPPPSHCTISWAPSAVSANSMSAWVQMGKSNNCF